jgi:hypothetical protein
MTPLLIPTVTVSDAASKRPKPTSWPLLAVSPRRSNQVDPPVSRRGGSPVDSEAESSVGLRVLHAGSTHRSDRPTSRAQ